MGVRTITLFLSGILLSLLVACGADPAPTSPVSNWQFDGSTYQVVSGIAGDVPPIWAERGWPDGGVLVYLADQDVTCDDFPREVTNEFPPRLLSNGATIWLKLTEKNTETTLNYASFDVMTTNSEGGTSGSGLGTDAVQVGLTSLEEGRARGWLEYTSPVGDSQQIAISGSFDVPFCG